LQHDLRGAAAAAGQGGAGHMAIPAALPGCWAAGDSMHNMHLPCSAWGICS
jgi:hypothetical protein